MPQYLITYLGGDHPSSPEEQKRHFDRYKEWLISLGEAAVSPANPLRITRTVNSDGTVDEGGTTTMSGFTIIEADSIDSALTVAQKCPFLEIGGTLEVSEMAQMPFEK